MKKKKINKHIGFLTYDRETPSEEDPKSRVGHFKEFYEEFSKEKNGEQASRCMDCGIPFCHSACPLGNNIPAFNDAVHRGEWKEAYDILDETNNFPEFTGRVCPAPCEKSCVLSINQDAVSIEQIEKSIIEEAYRQNWVKPKSPTQRSGKRIAVIGSGPAGLAAAEELNLQGHRVVIFEKDHKPGGLLRYGIPDFKLEKWVIDRRLELMEASGIEFQCNTEVGKDIEVRELKENFDAIILCIGAPVARDMDIPGRQLKGVELAMNFLTKQNRQIGGEIAHPDIHANQKEVLVIGGGDTGSDCIGTARRQGAQHVFQLTWGDRPPEERATSNPWPEWPMVMETSSSQAEGCSRSWNLLSKEFVGNEKGELQGLKVVEISWNPGRKGYKEIEGSERIIPCQLALISIGFNSVGASVLLQKLGVELNGKGRIEASDYKVSDQVFVAGDARRGASLIVWAIQEGRQAAHACMAELNKQMSGELSLAAS